MVSASAEKNKGILIFQEAIMFLLHLKLSNQTINIDLINDVVTCSSPHILKIKGAQKTSVISAEPFVIKEFIRRIDAAREDKLVDCRDLHGAIA